MNILIVDDSKAMRMIVAKHLRQAGFGDATIAEAANGAEALEAIKGDVPDLVLCDWNMPEMNGHELKVALNDAGIEVTFGFVTSEGTPEMRKMADDAGASFFISKPFTVETFEQVLGGLTK